jgi:uncharacterized membrane protein
MFANSAPGPVRIASSGHALFAVTLIALGILGLARGDFPMVWEDGQPARSALTIIWALVSLACGIGLLWPRTAALAARVLLGCLLLWLLLAKGPEILRAPMQAVTWESCGETTAIVAGAWVLYAWFATAWDKRHLAFATGEKGVRIAQLLYGFTMIAFGVAHFAYLQYTASLVPAWLPGHVGWTVFTGAAYIAAGAAILSGLFARLAAALSAVQMGVFTLLVWFPVLAAGPKDESDWSEIVISWMLTVAGWVVADSYRGVPWLAAGRRLRPQAT